MAKQITHLFSIIFVALMLPLISFSQFAVGGGLSTMFQFGNTKPLIGGNLLFEMPRNNDVSFYVRAQYLAPQNKMGDPMYFDAIARDPATQPFTTPVKGFEQARYGYFIIDAGTRYYLLNGFDEGISIYGGSNVGVVINTIKYGYQTAEYDTQLYSLDAYNLDEYRGKGSIFGLAIGFTGGVKYTKPGIGTFFFDINPHLMMFAVPSNNMIPTEHHKNLLFNFNIGFRKEFYK